MNVGRLAGSWSQHCFIRLLQASGHSAGIIGLIPSFATLIPI